MALYVPYCFLVMVVTACLWSMARASSDVEDASQHHQARRSHKRLFHANLAMRHDLTRVSRADPTVQHEVIFAVHLNNIDALRTMVDDISDIHSPNYGNHLTRQQLSEMVSNWHATDILTGYLTNFSTIINVEPDPENTNNIVIVNTSRDGRFLTAQAPLSVWERMFNTEFHVFSRTNSLTEEVDMTVHRSLSYEIPEELSGHVRHVLHTVQMPPLSNEYGPKREEKSPPLRSAGVMTDSGGGGVREVQERAGDSSEQVAHSADTLMDNIEAAGSMSTIVFGGVTPQLINNFCK
jgi:hypothetical protein